MSYRGFTLLEVLIILAIMAILMTIAFPLLQRFYINGNLRSAARDLIGDFNNQKQKAMSGDPKSGNLITEGTRIHRILVDMGANRYTLQRCKKTDNTCDDWDDIQVKNLNAYGSDVAFDAGSTKTTAFDFQPRGTVTFLNEGTIGLRNNRGSTAQITASISGRTFVEFSMQ